MKVFKPSAVNSGSVAADNGKRTIPVIHPDGTPVRVGDLKPGDTFEFNPSTGIIVTKKKANSAGVRH